MRITVLALVLALGAATPAFAQTSSETLPVPTGEAPRRSLEGLKPEEEAVYNAISNDETPIDAIILKCGLPTHQVASTLFALELKRFVKQLPGKQYVTLS